MKKIEITNDADYQCFSVAVIDCGMVCETFDFPYDAPDLAWLEDDPTDQDLALFDALDTAERLRVSRGVFTVEHCY